MAKKVKVLRTKPDDWSPTPRTHMETDLNTPPNHSLSLAIYAHTIIHVFNVFLVK